MTRLFQGVRWPDLTLALALTALGLLAASAADADYDGAAGQLVAAMLLQTAPLVWLRTKTLLAVGLSAFGVAVEVAGVPAYGDAAGFLSFLLLVFGSARWAAAGQRRAAGAVLAMGFVVHLAAQPHEGPLGLLGPVVTAGALSAAAWSLGTSLRQRAERVALLEDRTAELERSREQLVEEERWRISRELHDIVGHALSAISLSAGAAETRAGDDVAQSLRLIRETSRDAAADVRRLVGLLRTGDDVADLSPQPTLRGLQGLVERCRSAGLLVSLELIGDPDAVPLGVQLTVYRVVQEGLTNAVKHAPGAQVSVRVVVRRDQVEVEVCDDARGSVAPGAPGHGLVGLEERVRLYEGRLTATRGAEGWRLTALIPLARS